MGQLLPPPWLTPSLCRAMLEEAENRRLLQDSDSDEEPARVSPHPAAKLKATDFLQEVSEPRAGPSLAAGLQGLILGVHSAEPLGR